jgi:uncharacterized protein (TIGR03067 family)
MRRTGKAAAGFRLADAQLEIARASGFASWPGLARHVEQLRSLEGEWSFVSLEVDGSAMPAGAFGSSRMLIDGDRFRMESPEAHYEGIFNIDVEQQPAHIDIEFVEGPEAGEWSYGIHALDGDSLTICLGLVGSSRPTAFATKKGSGHALETLRRMSKARPADVTGGKRPAGATKKSAPPPTVDESLFALASTSMTPLLKRLQGEWLPVSLVTGGKPMDDRWLAFGHRTQSGNETKVVFGGQTQLHALMRIDESVSPIAIDYLNVGNGARVVSLGVMDFVGDEWRACMAKPGAPRPADFSCDAGSGRTLSRWKAS